MINEERFKDLEKYPQKEKVFEAAKMYINNGMFVVPLAPNTKKLPDKKYGVNYGSASRNISVIEKWFHPDNGKFAGWNIGIACGREGGVFALDVDRHGDQDGFEELEILEGEYGRLPDCPVQVTPNGGKHYLFRWQENASSSTRKVATAIDTRGGTATACKGHIVAYPSIVDGKQYRWEHGGNLPDIPPWVMSRMGVAWKERKEGRGNEGVSDDDLEKVIPVQQIKDMLGFIDPDDLSYDEWLRIGMAIKSQYPDDEGLMVWDGWSSKGSRYKKGECLIRWDGLDPAGPVRAGTIYYHAKEHGWTPSPDDVTSSPWDEIVERLNTEYAIVVIGGKIKILKEKVAINRWEEPYDIISKDDFKTLFENKIHAWIRPSDGKAIMRTEAEIWLAHQARREYPNGIGLFPEGNPPGVFNTWQGYTTKPKEGDISPYIDHVLNVVCSGDQSHCDWVLDWIADLIQDPGNPKGCALVMKGEEGVGKGSFVEPLGKLFGPHYTHLIDSSHLTGRFTGHMERAVLVFADEVVWGGDKKAEGKLKGLVTEDVITTERKGIDAISQRNFAHVIMASNNDWVIPAGPQSRRWFVLEVSKKKAGDFEYFKELKRWLKEEDNMSALLHYFMEREITHNLRKAPETKALKDQRDLYIQYDPITRWWTTCVQNRLIDVPDDSNYKEDTDWPQLVDRMLLFNHFEEWCLKRQYRVPSSTVFYKKVRDFGLRQVRPASDEGTRKYKFKVPKIEVAVSALYHMGINTGDDDE